MIYFHVIDYVVLALMLILSLGIGVYFACFGGKQKTTKEYFKGDSNMGMVPVVLSLMASFISSTGMLGVPAEVYHYGGSYWFTILGAFLGVPIATYGFLPVFYNLKITSVYEYLERRFNRNIRLCGSCLAIVTLLINASFVTYGPALALSQVTGLNLWGSILTTTIVGTVYTSMGGIKAVMWTDSMQMLVYTTAILVTIVKGTMDLGGFSAVLSKAEEGGRLEPLSFSLDPRVRYTFWVFLIGSSCKWINGYGVNQLQVQRYLSCPTKKAAQIGVWLNAPGLLLVTSIYCFVGLMLYAMYWTCDPLSSQQIQEPDQVFPLFVMEIMGSLPGLPGLFVAGVYSASLSTLSSVLNSLAAITLEDHVKPHWKDLTDEKATKISKFLAIIYGVLCLLMIIVVKHLGSIVQASNYLQGGTNGASLALFVMGLMVPWANPKGAIFGAICGVSVAWWITLGNRMNRPLSNYKLSVSTENCDEILNDWSPRVESYHFDDILEIYKISFLWIMPISLVVGVVVGSICSYFVGENKKTIDPNLYSPLAHFVMKHTCKKYYKKVCGEAMTNGFDSVESPLTVAVCPESQTVTEETQPTNQLTPILTKPNENGNSLP